VRIQWVESKRGMTMHSRVQDPGTPILQLQVRDARATLRALKAAGLQVISEGGEVVPRENGGAFVILRDPNNLFLELFQRGPAN
jgi:predicted enzyme related to lactoylglutathione lyase